MTDKEKNAAVDRALELMDRKIAETTVRDNKLEAELRKDKKPK